MQRMLPLMLKDTATFCFYRRKLAVTPAVRVLCNGAQVLHPCTKFYENPPRGS